MNLHKPLFSIVIVNYNHDKFLEETILSIIDQSCQDFELIIVDGGSKDNSVKIIKKYEHKLAYWISENDNGQSDAFNKGFKKARGKFLFWVNADDVLLTGSLKKAKLYIDKFPKYKWFAANTIFFAENGKILKCRRGPKWRDYFMNNAPINVYGPTSIFRRDIFEKENGFDESLFYTMDTDLWMRFKNSGIKFKRIPYYFWGFREHELSKTSHAFSNKPIIKFAEERIKIQNKNNHYYTKKGIILQNIYKILSGTYLVSWYDSKKKLNMNIDKLV